MSKLSDHEKANVEDLCITTRHNATAVEQLEELMEQLEGVEPDDVKTVDTSVGTDGKKFELSTFCRKESGSKTFTFSYGLFEDTCQGKVYRLLLFQIASDDCQIIPFCSVEHGLQGHTLLAAATSAPRQTYLPSSHPPPSLFTSKKDLRRLKFRCADMGNGKQKLNLSSFGGPLTAWVRNPTKSIFVPGGNFLYRTKPRLVHFCTGNLGSLFFKKNAFSSL